YHILHIRIKPGTYTIEASLIGLEKKQQSVTVSAGSTTQINFMLNENSSTLNEVNISTRKARNSTIVAKMPLADIENPQVYNSVSAELIKTQGIVNYDDAMRNIPGISRTWESTGRAGDGGAYFALRGFDAQPVLTNGLPGLTNGNLDVANVEEIQVIKGPSATLFGSNLTSFGGLINRVTKKPYEVFGLEVAHTVGNYDLNRTSVDLNTPLDKNNDVLFRFNSAYNYEGSFQNYGKSRSFAAAPTLSVKVNDKLSLLFEAELFYSRNSAKPFFFFYSTPKQLGLSNANQLNIDYKQAYSNDNITQFSRSTNYFAQANYKISDHFTSQTIFSSSNSFSNGASPYYYLVTDAVALNDPTAVGNNYILRYDQSTSNSKLNATEVQQNFNGDFNIGSMRNRFVVGLDYQHQNSRQVYFGNFYGAAPINSATFDYGAFNKQVVDATNAANPLTSANTFPYIFKTNTYSAYVSDVINLTEELIASAGVRVDHYENKGSFNLDGVETSKPFSQTAFAPKFGLIFQPIKDQLSLFANVQGGFVNPGVYTNADNTPTVAKLQQATQIEGGVKMAMFDGKLNGTISYYNIDLTNIYSVHK
ncbi:MAG: TonB-dependent siderophore receptor, partial [Pedobacter sp.]